MWEDKCLTDTYSHAHILAPPTHTYTPQYNVEEEYFFLNSFFVIDKTKNRMWFVIKLDSWRSWLFEYVHIYIYIYIYSHKYQVYI